MITVFLMALQVLTVGTSIFGGIIVMAYVWKKFRPTIIIKTDKGTFHFAISHSSKRKNMKKLDQQGINDFKVDPNSCYALSNKPSEIIDSPLIGTVSAEKAQEMLDNLETKKLKKIEKRSKK